MKKLKQFWHKFWPKFKQSPLLQTIFVVGYLSILAVKIAITGNEFFIHSPQFIASLFLLIVVVGLQWLLKSAKFVYVMIGMTLLMTSFTGLSALSSGSVDNLGLVLTGDKYNPRGLSNLRFVRFNYRQQKYVFVYHNVTVRGYDAWFTHGWQSGITKTLGPQ